MVTTSEYINREAPDIEARKLGLMDTAKALAEQPLTLPQYQLAGFTQAEQDAFLKAQQGIGGYAPWLNLAGTGIAQGQAATLAAQNLLGGITGAPTQAQLDPYLNPFQQQVIDQTMQELDKRGATAQQNLAGQAQQAGAFGGSRFGVQGAELGRGLQDARAQALTQLNAQNYAQAMGGYQNQMERQRLAGLGIGALGQQQAGFGGQSVSEACNANENNRYLICNGKMLCKRCMNRISDLVSTEISWLKRQHHNKSSRPRPHRV